VLVYSRRKKLGKAKLAVDAKSAILQGGPSLLEEGLHQDYAQGADGVALPYLIDSETFG